MMYWSDYSSPKNQWPKVTKAADMPLKFNGVEQRKLKWLKHNIVLLFKRIYISRDKLTLIDLMYYYNIWSVCSKLQYKGSHRVIATKYVKYNRIQIHFRHVPNSVDWNGWNFDACKIRIFIYTLHIEHIEVFVVFGVVLCNAYNYNSSDF